ncbi:ectoine/hydroxyectoine ABC transporter permease subunit EhuC [Candidatus Manganitrophus noduliformans]|uniref:Ectoine/hydroxyectoine ABC transporter permease subunit EhuC n=1 Tax=Candidatus Manganitrophus noduliformans TaxID=2606439 RepID=A0A7X6DL98_9BACT|nr:ectoine/hydroxyectoine ABC transporter permease subunit EhuC [Candidatus Manganitrophus noduliformans]NKE69256.1 ectoine/hydroxyectoine ABC transporter permease subunit EhuC [Candidatus Manganitrophus noduliformans]
MLELFHFLPPLLSGLWVTIQLAFGGSILAVLAAFAVGLLRLSRKAGLRIAATAYTDFFRGTSALVQLFWVYFALPFWGVELDAMTAGIVVLGLNHGAYGAEVVRGAVQAVPRPQYEAAAALNFTERQTLWRIILPQALPAMLPPFGNLLIELLKSTALVSMITLGDLTFQGQILRAATLRSGEIFTLVLLLYFMLALSISFGVRRLERRLAVGRVRRRPMVAADV